MSDEILYRGKQINNGKWHYGDLLKFGNKCYVNICPRFVDEYIVEEDKIALYSFGNFIEVIPETIERYTGLIDRNGVKIFEGDILEAINGNRGYVMFINGAFMKSCNSKDMPFLIASDVNTVIGNIHDNPELIGGTENETN